MGKHSIWRHLNGRREKNEQSETEKTGEKSELEKSLRQTRQTEKSGEKNREKNRRQKNDRREKTGASKAKASSKASAATSGLDKSVAQFRESLEHSVTLSRDRIQEVVDDAVKRGRMTRGDAEKMVRELIQRGKKQTDSLLGELEKFARQARKKLP